MIKLPKIGAHMDRSRSILFCLVVSAMIAAAPAYESAWGKDGNIGSGSGSSGSGGGSGSSGGGGSGKGDGNSGKGNSGEGRGAGSSTGGSTVSSLENPNSETVGRTRAMRPSIAKTRPTAKKKKRMPSTSELQADFQHAQLALKEAELTFNRALADPKADLRKLEQAIRNAELALSTAGARLAVAAAGK